MTADFGHDEQDHGVARQAYWCDGQCIRYPEEKQPTEAATICSCGDDALDHKRRSPHGPMYDCPGVGLPDFASLQWMARTHSESIRTSSAARMAETYPRRVDLACPILTRDARHSASMSVSDDCSAVDPSKPANVDRADRYLVWVLGADPRTPTAATRYEPTAAIAMAQQAAAARKVGPGAWEGSGA